MRHVRHIPLTLALTALLTLLPAGAQASRPADSAAGTAPTAAQAVDPQSEPDRVTWDIVPSDAEGADGRVSFRYELDPGEQVSDHVEVTNYSDRTVTFALMASDGVVGTDGAFDLLPSDVPPEDVGTWIDIPDGVELGPLESAVLPFTLAVPTDAIPGDHPGGMVAVLSQSTEDADGTEVGLDARVGARVHLRVTGEVAASLVVSDLTARYETSWNPFSPGTLHLDYTVANDGNVRVGSTQQIGANGPFGLTVGAATADPVQREILPAQSVAVSVSRDSSWPLGPVNVAVTAVPSIVGEDVIDAELQSATAEATVWAVPWAQLVLLALLACLVVALVVRRRRRRRALAAALARAKEEGAREARERDEPDPGRSPALHTAEEHEPKGGAAAARR